MISLFSYKFWMFHLHPRCLVQFVNSTAYAPEQKDWNTHRETFFYQQIPEHVLCYPTHLEYAIQDLPKTELRLGFLQIRWASPVVHFDHKLADVDSSEDLVDNLDTLCVRDHGIVLPGNVEVTLVKLPELYFSELCEV